jgi:hypothetical protein
MILVIDSPLFLIDWERLRPTDQCREATGFCLKWGQIQDAP